ncbi:endonuclease domain-containing protein [Piscinibacter sp.]|uniref:endonuclease domain-containing protein n=1 Tax=Piscinibacter sp. TaxID=1903157 RepID=UPI002C875A00|nr:endonuclease domain-containing protein [Albitalea sp.]HUG21783.1 endonuclease domain-containing protein [Albitalea sp.]
MTPQASTASPLSRKRERVRVRARGLRQSSPDAERALWLRLRNRQLAGYKFRRQHPIGPYFADFACVEAGLVVELDGGQHVEAEAVEYDRCRTAKLNEMGFHVLRFNDREALTERDGVLAAILDWLTAHHPHPNPLPQAGEGANASLPVAAEGPNMKDKS